MISEYITLKVCIVSKKLLFQMYVCTGVCVYVCVCAYTVCLPVYQILTIMYFYYVVL